MQQRIITKEETRQKVRETIKNYPRLLSEWHKGDEKLEVRLSRSGRLELAVCFYQMDFDECDFVPVGCLRFVQETAFTEIHKMRYVMTIENTIFNAGYEGFFYHSGDLARLVTPCTNSDKNSPL